MVAGPIGPIELILAIVAIGVSGSDDVQNSPARTIKDADSMPGDR